MADDLAWEVRDFEGQPQWWIVEGAYTFSVSATRACWDAAVWAVQGISTPYILHGYSGSAYFCAWRGPPSLVRWHW